jgi:hypothetical protein
LINYSSLSWGVFFLKYIPERIQSAWKSNIKVKQNQNIGIMEHSRVAHVVARLGWVGEELNFVGCCKSKMDLIRGWMNWMLDEMRELGFGNFKSLWTYQAITPTKLNKEK